MSDDSVDGQRILGILTAPACFGWLAYPNAYNNATAICFPFVFESDHSGGSSFFKRLGTSP